MKVETAIVNHATRRLPQLVSDAEVAVDEAVRRACSLQAIMGEPGGGIMVLSILHQEECHP